MPPTSPSTPAPGVHEIYTSWTTALTLPPMPRLSTLRRLVSTITSKSTPGIVLHPIPLSRLFLDLSLTYAYLGEYHLASFGFARVVNSDAQRAFALFALGLSRAELGDWKEAKISWMRCLRCFEQAEGFLEYIPYQPFQQAKPSITDGDVTTRNIGLGEQWLLERERVKFNLNWATLETGDKRAGIRRLGPKDPRSGLNGIPAGLRFGPDGWLNAELERAEAKVFRPLEDIGKPISTRSSPQSSDPSPVMKSLPPLPPRPKAPAPKVVSKVWYVDNPTHGEDLSLETSSPLTNPASIPSPSVYDDASSIGRNSIRSGRVTSPNSAMPTPYFSDGFEHDTYDETPTGEFGNITETTENIDEDAISLWNLPLNHPIFTNPDPQHTHQPSNHYDDGDEDDIEGDTTLITDFIPVDIGDQDYIENKGVEKLQHPPSDRTRDEEILQPRVFEGFEPRM